MICVNIYYEMHDHTCVSIPHLKFKTPEGHLEASPGFDQIVWFV